jgi:hypothetical protein
MAARPEITFRKWKLSSERNQRGAGDTSWRLMPRLCGANCGCRGSASSGAKNRLAAICLFLLPVLRTVSAHAFARLCGTVPAISQNGSLSSWLMRLSVLRGVPAERRLCFCRLAILAVAAMVWLISPFCDWYLQSPARNRSQNFQSSQQGAGTCQSLSDYIGSCRSRWAL